MEGTLDYFVTAWAIGMVYFVIGFLILCMRKRTGSISMDKILESCIFWLPDLITGKFKNSQWLNTATDRFMIVVLAFALLFPIYNLLT